MTWRPERGTVVLITGVIDKDVTPSEWWELKPGSLLRRASSLKCWSIFPASTTVSPAVWEAYTCVLKCYLMKGKSARCCLNYLPSLLVKYGYLILKYGKLAKAEPFIRCLKWAMRNLEISRLKSVKSYPSWSFVELLIQLF